MAAGARNRKAAFTLVEVLVVLGVIGVIIGLVVPAVRSIHAESQSTVCMSNLRQMFTALETARQQNKDALPYAAPLPVSPGQVAVVPALPERLSAIIRPDNEIWMCPADHTQDSQDIGTSYIYVPGAFMLLEPPLIGDAGTIEPDLSRIERVERLITKRFTEGYLRKTPIAADTEAYHSASGREPWNALFIDGNVRVGHKSDGEIDDPSAPPTPPPAP